MCVMPESIRFHLDENVDHAIADGLQRYGVDVTVTSEVDLWHATDDVQLAFAQDNTRVLGADSASGTQGYSSPTLVFRCLLISRRPLHAHGAGSGARPGQAAQDEVG
jgi:hypothetical protein